MTETLDPGPCRLPAGLDYSILTSAITDVGYWRWWSERLPEIFQLEFGGAQLYAPSDGATQPPTGLLALRFLRPTHAGFLRRKGSGDKPPADWPRQLQEDRIEPFPLSPDEFLLNDDARFGAILGEVESEDVHFTSDGGGRMARLVFWAGPVGCTLSQPNFVRS